MSWFPGIIREQGSKVYGEIYDIEESLLTKLDDFEDEGILYRRELVKILLDKKIIIAYTYIWMGERKI